MILCSFFLMPPSPCWLRMHFKITFIILGNRFLMLSPVISFFVLTGSSTIGSWVDETSLDSWVLMSCSFDSLRLGSDRKFPKSNLGLSSLNEMISELNMIYMVVILASILVGNFQRKDYLRPKSCNFESPVKASGNFSRNQGNRPNWAQQIVLDSPP